MMREPLLYMAYPLSTITDQGLAIHSAMQVNVYCGCEASSCDTRKHLAKAHLSKCLEFFSMRCKASGS